MSDLIDISGLDKSELLAGLINGTRARGFGVNEDTGFVAKETAAELIKGMAAKRWPLDFDYAFGRPVKTDISGDTMDPRLYDRDAGEGTAARVVAELRARQPR